MPAAAIIEEFVKSLNPKGLRLRRPLRFVFLCGGVMSDVLPSKSLSARDFLYRTCVDSFRSVPLGVVLSETANDLFLDSKYRDLIKFEEDVAQISDLVLLAGESAGSLAELGAFSMNHHIAPRLLVLLRTHHYEQKSFVRNGPIRFLQNEHGEQAVSVFPWGTFQNGEVRTLSIKPHLKNIQDDVMKRIDALNILEALDIESVRHKMIIVYWSTYISRAATLTEINEVANLFELSLTLDTTRRYLYCMRVAGWIGEQKYGNQNYYYPKTDVDPFDYSFSDAAKMRESVRWKRDVVAQLKSKLDAIKSVTNMISLAS